METFFNKSFALAKCAVPVISSAQLGSITTEIRLFWENLVEFDNLIDKVYAHMQAIRY